LGTRAKTAARALAQRINVPTLPGTENPITDRDEALRTAKATIRLGPSDQIFATQDTREDQATATFAAGCFWCTEAVFLRVKGVTKVVSGYIGGAKKNPTYKEVCTGLTGHAEAIRIEFDPSKITYEQLLEIFFYTHDPTTLNRQGADVGTQYRSAVFYHDDQQKKQATDLIAQLNKSGDFDSPIVTTLEPNSTFYSAEDYHQDYFANNPSNPYCMAVVGPKVSKFRKKFKDYLKKDGE